MYIPMYGLLCFLLGLLLAIVSGLALLAGLVLAVAGRRRSRPRRIGTALGVGSILPAAAAASMMYLPDAVGDPAFKERADVVSLALAPAAAAAGLTVGVLVAWALRRWDRAQRAARAKGEG